MTTLKTLPKLLLHFGKTGTIISTRKLENIIFSIVTFVFLAVHYCKVNRLINQKETLTCMNLTSLSQGIIKPRRIPKADVQLYVRAR